MAGIGNDYYIDLSDVVSIYDLTKEEYAYVRQSAVEAGISQTYRMIVEQIRDDLKSTRQAYYKGLSKPIIDRLKGSIELSGTLPNMIEQGAEPFDMKKGFARSSKAKKSKDGGWYFTVPFRWATPTSIGESEVFSQKMDVSMRDLVHDKGGGQITVEEIQSSRSTFGVIKQREEITKSSSSLTTSQRSVYVHKFPMGAGASRPIAPYKVAVQGKYVSFRRVSNKSSENSWINRGLEARNFMTKALYSEEVDDEVTVGVQQALNSLGK